MAIVHLGLSADAFFRLTPRQLHVLMDRHRERSEHEEWMAGIVASTVHNLSGKIAKKLLAPADFMPSFRREAIRRDRSVSPEAATGNIRCFLKAHIVVQEEAGIPSKV